MKTEGELNEIKGKVGDSVQQTEDHHRNRRKEENVYVNETDPENNLKAAKEAEPMQRLQKSPLNNLQTEVEEREKPTTSKDRQELIKMCELTILSDNEETEPEIDPEIVPEVTPSKHTKKRSKSLGRYDESDETDESYASYVSYESYESADSSDFFDDALENEEPTPTRTSEQIIAEYLFGNNSPYEIDSATRKSGKKKWRRYLFKWFK